jgi:hypothetical protein
MSIREGFRKTARPKVQAVDVSEWAEELGTSTVYVRRLMQDERAEVEVSKLVMTGKGKHREATLNMRPYAALVLSKTICDEAGTRHFGDSAADLADIRAMDGKLSDKLFDAALRFNGLKTGEEDDEGEEKNSSVPANGLHTA